MNKYLLLGLIIPIPILIVGYLMMANSSQSNTTPIPTPVQLMSSGQQPTTTSQQPATNSDTITPMAKQKSNAQPIADNFEKRIYTVTMTTSVGKIVLELDGTKTPITVNNFITLAKKGFYDNTIFHRTIANFMIQGGDPNGTGTGGPGYKFADEKFDGDYTRGTIAMANSGPNTNGSQFFIMHADVSLPKNYVIFGKVISGIETVDKIATAPTVMSDSGENSKPVTPVKILSMEVK